MSDQAPAAYDAVILAGGRARRMHGRDKPGEIVAGRSLVAWVAGAVSDAGRVVLVGEPRPELPDAVVVSEDPPGSGPVPALRAGLPHVRAPWVALLAADLPFLRRTHVALLRGQGKGADGAVLVDGDTRPQWLAGVWRSAALAAALSAYRGDSLYGLLAPLNPRRVAPPVSRRPAWQDCDTPEDLARARRRIGEDTAGGG